MGLRTGPYVLKALKAGYQDPNDYLEFGNAEMAQNAMRQLFLMMSSGFVRGKILEVGAGTGRFTREIVKYVPEDVQIVSLEYQYEAYY